MDIIAKIKPLYDDLVKIGLPAFMKDNEFIRACNELNLTEIYAKSHNECKEQTTDQWSWLTGIAEEDVLATLLNNLYNSEPAGFIPKVAGLAERCINFSYFIPAIDELQRDLELLGADKSQLTGIRLAWKKMDDNYQLKANVLRNVVTSRATGGAGEEEYYQLVRRSLLAHPHLKLFVPDYVADNETQQDFWQFIKFRFPSYAERRFFIKDTFGPLLDAALSLSASQPHTAHVESVTQQINEQYITQTWSKALQRMQEDPEAAITSARSLIEMVCKHILEALQVEYDDAADLPKLYKLTAAQLQLSPDQHTEQLFKQILGGCQTVVEGLGGLRNKLGDAHGASKKKARPSLRHAALAVNLSGSMCSFLLQTYLHHNG